MNSNQVIKTITLFVFSFFLFSFGIQKKTKLLMIGDSTMSDKEEKAFPENGWGMALASKVNESADIKNFARNGRSSKSFINEGLWENVRKLISKGDYVIIQFGHNDEKIHDTSRYTTAQVTFKSYLRKFITDTRERDATPVLCTPIVRRKFGKEDKLINTHDNYPAAIRELALEMNVALVDLEKSTEEKVNEAGVEKSKDYYMILQPGEYSNFPQGKEDNTHLKVEGAKMVADLFVAEIKKQQLPIAKLFK